MILADFLRGQFGVQTMAQYGRRFRAPTTARTDKSGTFALHTLERRRNHRPPGHRHQALQGARRVQLDQDLPARRRPRQERLRRAGPRHPGQRCSRTAGSTSRRPTPGSRPSTSTAPGSNNYRQDRARPDRRQLGPLRAGRDPAGRHQGHRRFPLPQRQQGLLRGPRDQRRQAARRREGLPQEQPGPARLEQDQHRQHRLPPGRAATRQQYLGDKVAAWDLDLKPRPDHVDDRVTVTTPLHEAGRLPADGQDGRRQPQPHHRLGQRHRHRQEAARRPDATTTSPTPSPASRSPRPTSSSSAGSRCRSSPTPTSTASIPPHFNDSTDADGQLILGKDKLPQQLPVAGHRPQGEGRRGRRRPLRLPRLHQRLVRPAATTPSTTRPSVFTITDRPGLSARADGAVQGLGAHAKYDQPDTSDFAGKTFTVQIHNPKGEKVFEKALTADEYGGLDRRVRRCPRTPRWASTASVQSVTIHGGGSFRVEEYKKPEFEVTVEAPKEPVSSARRSRPPSRPSITSAPR